MRATVIGDCLLDVAAAPEEPMRRGGDVPASVHLAPGGQAANVAVRLARRGSQVRLVAPLGDDAAGAWLRDAMRREGVALDALPAPRSGAVVIVTGEDGERSMLSDRVPFPPVWRPVTVAALADADVICCSGYSLLDPVGAELARELGARGERPLVVAGCAISGGAAGAFADRVLAAGPSLVVLNRDEATALHGPPSAAPSTAGLARLAGSILGTTVVVTDGSRPSAASIGEATLAPAVGSPAASGGDATGAGDAYVAVLIAALPSWPPDAGGLQEAMVAAARAAGEVAGTRGAQAPISGERAAAVAS